MTESVAVGRIGSWLTMFRLPFHTVGVFPFISGAVLAWSQGAAVNVPVMVLATVAVSLIMLTTYLAGEYYDFEGDSLNRDFNKFSGGSRVLQVGLLPRRYALLTSWAAFGLAVAIGLVIQFYFKTGPFTIPLGAFGLLCGYFYSARPGRWAARGVGETLIGICYGWLTVNTGYYLQAGHFSLMASLASIPIAITIFLVILINEFPDYDSDKATGKRTLVVRHGKDMMAVVYSLLLGLTPLTMLLSRLYGAPPLVGWLTIPVALLAAWNIKAMSRHGYLDDRTLEGICARTIVTNLLIAILFIVGFAVGG